MRSGSDSCQKHPKARAPEVGVALVRRGAVDAAVEKVGGAAAGGVKPRNMLLSLILLPGREDPDPRLLRQDDLVLVLLQQFRELQESARLARALAPMLDLLLAHLLKQLPP